MSFRAGRPVVVLACAALAFAYPAAAAKGDRDDVLRGDLLGCPGSRWPWSGQGFFVNIPAGLAASPAALVGTGLALALVPADLVASAASSDPQAQHSPIPRFARIGVCGGVYLGKGLAYAAGAPFWLLKQAFWDGPKRVFSGPRPAGAATFPAGPTAG